MRDPMVLDSLQVNPEALAAMVHPNIFPKYARAQIAIVYPQVMPAPYNIRRQHIIEECEYHKPLFKSLKSVDRPDNVKYYVGVSTEAPVHEAR